MSLDHAITSVSTDDSVASDLPSDNNPSPQASTHQIGALVDNFTLDASALSAGLEHATKQLAHLRLIADRAAAVAINGMDMEQTPTDEVELIARYLGKTGYLDDLEDDATFITGVIHPLLAPELAPLMDYVAIANRDAARKKRIREELGQLKVMGEKFEGNDPITNLFKVELKAAERALLFALSDVTDLGLLMSLSPSVRIAQHLSLSRLESGGNLQIDWGEGAGDTAGHTINQGEESGTPVAGA